MSVLQSLFIFLFPLLLWVPALRFHIDKGKRFESLSSEIQLTIFKCRHHVTSDGTLDLHGRKAFGSSVVRSGVQMPHSPCQLSRRALENLLAQPHNCTRGGSRVWLGNRWYSSQEMERVLSQHQTTGQTNVACVLFCVHRHPPCEGERPCLIPVYLRPNSSDFRAAVSIFEGGELDVLKQEWDLTVILDAGAGIGLASVLLAVMFPDAVVLSAEPDPDDFEVLLLNAHSHPNVLPVNAAVSSRLAQIPLAVEPSAARTLRRKQKPSVQGLTVPSLLDIFMLPGVDLLRLGQDHGLLSSLRGKAGDWLSAVKFALVGVADQDPEGVEEELSGVFSGGSGWKYLGWWKQYKVYRSNKLVES